MAKVPLSFQAEPGQARCGDSFAHSMTVTGEIPNRSGFGSDKKKWISKVTNWPAGNWASFQSSKEGTFVEDVKMGRNRLEDDLIASAPSLTTPQENAIIYLIRLVDANLAKVREVYDYWDGKGPHPSTGVGLPHDFEHDRTSDWPLKTGDAIYQHVSECTGVSGQWVEDRELVGQNVKMIRWYFCPDGAMREQRAKDRVWIRKLLLDSARAVRCGQWGVWRMRLYNEALTEWEEKYGGFGFKLPPGPPPKPDPSPFVPEGGPQFGIYQPPGEPPPPPGPEEPPPFQPADFIPPPPGDLPPPDDEPEEPDLGEGPDALPPPLGPEGLPPVPPAPPPTTPGQPGIFSKKNLPLFVGAGALALFALTR